MKTQFESIVRRRCAKHDLPGIAAVISVRGVEQFAIGHGRCDLSEIRAIDGNTMFGVASLTKLMTACATLKLVDAGILSIDDPVARYFPALQFATRTDIRLRHLLSHSSGLPALPSRFHALNLTDPTDASGGVREAQASDAGLGSSEVRGIQSADGLVEFINGLDVKPLDDPGVLLNYSNEGFCLLGAVLEVVTGETFSSLVARLVLGPLQMERTLFGDPGLKLDANVAPLMVRYGDVTRPSPVWNAPLFYPAGGAFSSARDLVRLFQALGTDCAYLSRQSRASITSPLMSVPSRPDARFGYGLGVEYRALADDSDTLLWHSGQRAGVSSFVGYLRERQIAVSVLCNMADVPVASIGNELLADCAGLDNLAWPPITTPAQVPSPDLRQFEGDFASPEGFRFSVAVRGNTLYLSEHGRTTPFLFAGEDHGIVGEQTFRFLGAGHRRPRSIALDLRVFESPGSNN